MTVVFLCKNLSLGVVQMEFLERLFTSVAVVLTAVAPIVVAIISNSKKDREQNKKNSENLCNSVDEMKKTLEITDGRIQVLERHAREDHRRLLVMEIMEDHLPIEARLEAGRKYVDEGWNGAIKAKYEVMLHDYEQKLKGGA